MSEAYTAMTQFATQVKRATGLKVVVKPSSIAEKGVIVSLSMRKTHRFTDRASSRRVVKLRLAVEGRAESLKGLELALDAIETIDEYLGSQPRLEDSDGHPIPNTLVTQVISEEDSFLDTPDSTQVQEVIDERLVTLHLSA